MQKGKTQGSGPGEKEEHGQAGGRFPRALGQGLGGQGAGVQYEGVAWEGSLWRLWVGRLGRGGGVPFDSALTPPSRGLPLERSRAEAADVGVGAEGEFPTDACAGHARERLGASEAHVAKVRAGPGWGRGFWPRRRIP